MHFAIQDLDHLLALYGYWAVLIFVAIESTGIPFPGETMLLTAAIYAGSTHHLNIFVVVVAAAAGAILGDNLGYFVGREGGYRLLRRFGRFIHVRERELKLGQLLFMRHGGKVVFFGRFVSILRTYAAFLAGVNHMRYPAFFLANAAGGIIWAAIYGFGGFILGKNVDRFTGPTGIVFGIAAIIIIVVFLFFLRRNFNRLADEAERELPGSLDHYRRGAGPRDASGKQDITANGANALDAHWRANADEAEQSTSSTPT
jgi:membrane protein DedA with SNARE-associated domain